MLFRCFKFISFAALFSILSAYHITVSATSAQETLVLGSISTKPSKAFKRLDSLALYLQTKLSETGIKRVKIKVAKNIEQMQSYIDAGEVDLFSETVLTAIKIENVDVRLLRWKKGVDRYQSLLITHKDNHIHSINDLVGKSIALEDTGSTSGYLVPMLAITNFTDQIIKKDNVQQINNNLKVNYILSTRAYASSIDNLSIWAHRSIVDAAAISNIDWNNDKKFPTKIKQDLRVFYRSVDIPRSLTMYRANLDPTIKQAITAVLINAHNDPQGKIAIKKFAKTKKFTLLTTQQKKDIEDARQGYNQRVKGIE